MNDHLLVEVRAVTINPFDYKVASGTAPEAGGIKVVGYDAAGVVVKAGRETRLFKPGDEVFYAGSIGRQGANAEYHLVDERIVGRKPRSLDFPAAAALPLTSITAWEAMFDRLDVARPVPGARRAILILGGAGGVGSIAIQLARQLTETTVLPFLCDGGVCGTFIDWRGLPTVHSAAAKVGLFPLNLIVWAKTNAGMGSLYRSQHELLPLFKNGSAPHVNNVELGKRGRWRSNVWTYPGASSLGSDARRGLKDHPTVKPTAMLEDALLDLTNRGDIVIDPFLGSGSTLIAADKTGRVCRGVELDPLYVDVIVRRTRPPPVASRSSPRPARRSRQWRRGGRRREREAHQRRKNGEGVRGAFGP